MERLSRLPVRVRVTLAFSGVMAVVLAATGLFLYLRLGAELDAAIDQGLRSRAGDVRALGRSSLVEEEENLAQVLDASGRVVEGTPSFREQPVLSPSDQARAARQTIVVDRTRVPGGDDPVRLLATPDARDGRVVVVGASLDDRDDALASLAGLLLVGGPVALLLASLAGSGAAAAALRPVERMRRQAASIGDADSGRRLPVPPARDEIGRLGATLNEMLDRLEGAFARERRLVADASHELRTPLAIVKAELELALREGRTVEELEAAVRSAAEETDRLVRLAEDLLVLARADEGGLPVRRGHADVEELLGSVRGRFARRAESSGAALDVTSADTLVLSGDPLRIEQAVGNLVDNALRHGGQRIELAATAHDGHVELHVRDDGPGFPEAFLPTAFERFTRADAARGRGGAGLGLAIVAAIARAHGGTVGVRNRAEGGADVWLALPGYSVSSSESPSTTTTRN